MSPCTSLTFKLHRRRESTQTCKAPGVLLESRQIAKSLFGSASRAVDRLCGDYKVVNI